MYRLQQLNNIRLYYTLPANKYVLIDWLKWLKLLLCIQRTILSHVILNCTIGCTVFTLPDMAGYSQQEQFVKSKHN